MTPETLFSPHPEKTDPNKSVLVISALLGCGLTYLFLAPHLLTQSTNTPAPVTAPAPATITKPISQPIKEEVRPKPKPPLDKETGFHLQRALQDLTDAEEVLSATSFKERARADCHYRIGMIFGNANAEFQYAYLSKAKPKTPDEYLRTQQVLAALREHVLTYEDNVQTCVGMVAQGMDRGSYSDAEYEDIRREAQKTIAEIQRTHTMAMAP